jgi:hypothetical protein
VGREKRKSKRYFIRLYGVPIGEKESDNSHINAKVGIDPEICF